MPAIMDDPSAPTIHRMSGAPPYPDPTRPALPANIRPRQVTLRDRQSIATVVPFVSRDQVPPSLLRYLSDQFAKEIEGGDTYPMIDPMPFDKFSAYWLQNFAGVMLLGQINSPDEVVEGKDWSRECLGSFYIKPNYPGRSSHVCNAGFLVTDLARNRGVGRLMGEAYLDWAPRLGYTYSVFNLVYETNVASCKIWDALGFKRIGRVKGCGNLKSYPDRLVDAIIYGRDLGTEAGEGGDPLLVSEERFDKIKFYLKSRRYPNGSDRAEKSRLRSAATHYHLLDNDVLMLKDKEVISDPIRQMAVARKTHEEGGHAGINKTTSVIAEKYHWSRIKETVSDVIRTCDQCKDVGKSPSAQSSQNQNQNQNQSQDQPAGQSQAFSNAIPGQFHDVNETRSIIPDRAAADLMAPQPPPLHEQHGVEATGRIIDLHHTMHEASPHHELASHLVTSPNPYTHASDITSLLNPPFRAPSDPGLHMPTHNLMLAGNLHHASASAAATLASLHDTEIYHPIDPQIISQPVVPSHPHHPTAAAFASFRPPRIPLSHHHHHHHPDPTSPHISHTPLSAHDLEYSPHVSSHAPLSSDALHGISPAHDDAPHDEDPDSFQALLNDADATALTIPAHHHHHHHQHHDQDDAVDRDMAMLIEHHDTPSPMHDPCASTLACEMDIDDLGLGTVKGVETTKRDSEVDGDSDMGDGKGKEVDGVDGDVDIGGSAFGSKRSDIYDVVFDGPG
ncbi:hypothetical protein F5Y03DRAFT_191102 [Xylaria venustula]|nr:hypothetical protein F5Y03DRAFT_191102 [Xylaria venustula]